VKRREFAPRLWCVRIARYIWQIRV
jgi:hypothetical protein